LVNGGTWPVHPETHNAPNFLRFPRARLRRAKVAPLAVLEEYMRSAALLVGLFTIAVGIVGLVSPESVSTVRRLYFATPVGLYSAAAVRVGLGLVLILCARASRAPKTLRAPTLFTEHALPRPGRA